MLPAGSSAPRADAPYPQHAPRLLLFLLTLALRAAPVDLPPPIGDPSADLRKLQEFHAIHVLPSVERGTDAHFAHVLHRALTLRTRGLAFIAAHSTDPRRWVVLVLLQHSGALEVITQPDGSRVAAQPAVTAALWAQEYLGRLEDLLESAAAPPRSPSSPRNKPCIPGRSTSGAPARISAAEAATSSSPRKKSALRLRSPKPSRSLRATRPRLAPPNPGSPTPDALVGRGAFVPP